VFEGPVILKDVVEDAAGVDLAEAAIEVDSMEEDVVGVDRAEEDVRGPKFQPLI
jgi:hypothetical protein